MKAESLHVVFEALGSYASEPRTNSRGDWGSVSCPLSPYTHGGGQDKKPSMMVSTEEGPSYCKCLGCGFSGSIRHLVNTVAEYGGIKGEVKDDLLYFVLLESGRNYQLLEGEDLSFKLPSRLERDLGVYHPYFAERGISEAQVREWYLGYSGDEQRALFPIWDIDGTLIGVVGRAVSPFVDPKYKIYPEGIDRSNHLFGITPNTQIAQQLLVVEGYIDVIKATEALPHVAVVGLGTAHASKSQLRLLASLVVDELVIGLDNDNAGLLASAKLIHYFTGRCKLSRLEYGVHKDADEAFEDLPNIFEAREGLGISQLQTALKSVIKS